MLKQERKKNPRNNSCRHRDMFSKFKKRLINQTTNDLQITTYIIARESLQVITRIMTTFFELWYEQQQQTQYFKLNYDNQVMNAMSRDLSIRCWRNHEGIDFQATWRAIFIYHLDRSIFKIRLWALSISRGLFQDLYSTNSLMFNNIERQDISTGFIMGNFIKGRKLQIVQSTLGIMYIQSNERSRKCSVRILNTSRIHFDDNSFARFETDSPLESLWSITPA
jgi:hypothetical protein